MGKVVVIYSVRPESPDVNLESVKEEIKDIENFDNLEEKDFMFGLKQIFATFTIPDKSGMNTDKIEEKLKSIKGVSSINQEAITLA